MAFQDSGDLDWLAGGGSFIHGLHQGNGPDSFDHIRSRRPTVRQAARKVFDVVLVFSGVV
jgi:hypothetical protein